MKAIYLAESGPPSSLSLVEQPKPTAGPGEIVVKVHAVGLNPVDYKVASRRSNRVLGLDVAGTVDSLGEGVTNTKIGDRVHYHGDLQQIHGGFAEYAVTTASTVVPIPDSVSFVDAAALPCAGWTAYQAVQRKTKLKPGQTVMITGGSGGVGGFGIQFAHLAGYKVITTCSGKNKDKVLELGATEVIDYNSEDIEKRVMQFTNGEKLNAWIDTTSADSATKGLSLIKFFGDLVFIAGTPNLAQQPLFEHAQSVHGVYLGGAHQHGKEAKEDLAAVGKEVMDLFAQGKIKSLVTKVISLEEIPAALQEIKDGHAGGKIVAQVVPN